MQAAVQGALKGEIKEEQEEVELVSIDTPTKNLPAHEGVTQSGRASFAINAADISFEIESQNRPSGVSQAEFANLVSKSLAKQVNSAGNEPTRMPAKSMPPSNSKHSSVNFDEDNE